MRTLVVRKSSCATRSSLEKARRATYAARQWYVARLSLATLINGWHGPRWPPVGRRSMENRTEAAMETVVNIAVATQTKNNNNSSSAGQLFSSRKQVN